MADKEVKEKEEKSVKLTKTESARRNIRKYNESTIPAPAAASATAEFVLRCNEIAQSAVREDPETLWACFQDYIRLCLECGKPVGNMAAYLSMGITRFDACDWRNGIARKSDPRYRALIQRVDAFCSVARETAAANGDVNVVWSIFCAKNYDGMRDQQEIITQKVDELQELRSADDIKRKYQDIKEE